MADSVTRSSKNGHNIPQLVDDDETPVVFYDWASFLKKMFNPKPKVPIWIKFCVTSFHQRILNRIMKTN
jgi:hypothetical protein